MCGIYGFTFPHETKSNVLETMGNIQIHRGPDGMGTYTDDTVALSMRRLSIIDLEHGNQPFFSKDKTVVAFCNGELYNYKALRDELTTKGYTFRTNSDIEILPHLYKEYGESFVTKLNGMYAIALYDKATHKLFLYRDRLGIKPIYYFQKGNNIVFSSEIKSVLASGFYEKEVDYQALSTYLDIMYIPRPFSPFKGIKKLDSGAMLKWDGNTITETSYWKPELTPAENISEQQHLNTISELIQESVQMQLMSDVPIGSFLSGGIDSSIVSALSAKLSDKTFSAVHMQWKDITGKTDESPYAKQVSDLHNIDLLIKEVSEVHVPDLLAKLVWHLEEPFADAAFVPTYLLANIAQNKIKVILSGAGGDELFGGYNHYKEYDKAKSMLSGLLFGMNPAKSYYDSWKPLENRFWKKYFHWYTPNVAKPFFEKPFQTYKHIDRYNAMMLNDILYYLQDNILFLTDKMTMATSLECRVPLLDHRLVEYSLKIPSSMKIKGNDKKHILKKYALDFLPREVMYRKKEGFGSPAHTWVEKYRTLYFDPLLESGFLIKNDIIDKRKIFQLMSMKSFTPEMGWFYWKILILEIWFQLFIGERHHENIFSL